MFARFVSLFERQPRTAEGWVARLGRPGVSPSTVSAFEAWLSADPRHLADYEALKNLLRETRALRDEFIGDLNLIPAAPPRRRAQSRNAWAPVALAGGLVAAALVAAVDPGLWTRLSPDPMAGATTYSTAVGEIRDVALSDGSVVTLDTATTLRARIGDGVRRVALDRGAAYFAVAHDKAHPFQVALADRQVVVTGTHFATTLRGDLARVELLEGSVAVSQPGAHGAALLTNAVRLRAGDQVSYRAGAVVRREARFDPTRAVAWREHRLVFEDAALSDVLTELGRYTDVRIRLADPALARQRVTAMLPLDGPDTVLAHADKLLPVTLTRTGPGEVTATAR